MPTHSARLVSAPLWAMVMPPRSASSNGTKLKYPTTPALNEPHMRPAAITGARIRDGGKPETCAADRARFVDRGSSGGAR